MIYDMLQVTSYKEIPAEKVGAAIALIESYPVLEGELLPPEGKSLATIQPPTWVRPIEAGMPGAGGNRTVIQMKKILCELHVWAYSQPFERETAKAIGDALGDIEGLIVTSQTEIQEAMTHFHIATSFLNRWRGMKLPTNVS